MANAAEKAKKVLDAKREKKREDSKRELKFLFGGLNEKQVDILLYSAAVLLLSYLAYTKVDWELNVFPRPFGEVFSANPDVTNSGSGSCAGYSAHDTFGGAIGAMTGTNASLVLFHSELFDGRTALFGGDKKTAKKNGVTLGSHALPEATPPQRLLRSIFDGTISHIVWVLPSWSSAALGMDNRATCRVAHLKSNPDALALSCGHVYFALRGVTALQQDLDMTKAVEVDIQMVPQENLHRRATTIFLNKDVFVHLDYSFFSRRDVMGRVLLQHGIPDDVVMMMKTLISPAQYCAPASKDDGTVRLPTSSDYDSVAKASAVLDAFETAFGSKQDAVNKPIDVFGAAFKPSLPYFCDGRGERHWVQLRSIYENLNKTHHAAIRTLGLPLGLGSSVSRNSDSLEVDVTAMEKMLGGLNWLEGGKRAIRSVTLSDETYVRSALSKDDKMKAIIEKLPNRVVDSLKASKALVNEPVAQEKEWAGNVMDPTLTQVAVKAAKKATKKKSG